MKKAIAVACFALVGLSLSAAASAQEKIDTTAMEALAKANTCLACHATDKKLVGPAYKAIAEKYAKDKDAAKNLSEKIIKGSTGVWGAIPMPANAQVKKEDADKLARWILSIK